MSLKKRLRTIFLCAALEVGVLAGVPMRPEEIRALMDQMNQPKLAHVLPSEDDRGNDPPDDRLSMGVLRHRIGPSIMPSNVGTANVGLERCVSCDAPLSGPYCSRCGERTLEPEALTLRYFLAHTVVHELLHVEGSLWRTLRVLFTRPAGLSLEYAAGRRRPYVNPFRLLLISIVAYVLMTSSGFIVTWEIGPVIVSMAPAATKPGLSVEDTIQQIDRYDLLRQQVAAKREQLASEKARERFHHRLAAFAQPVSFANVILLAATLHIIFRRKRRRFLEHAAFSMHFVSFVLLSTVTILVAHRLRFWLGNYLFLVFALFALWQFAYLVVAIRRFYLATGRWGSRLLSVAAAMLLYVLNTAFMTAVQVAGAAIALASF